MNLTIRHVSENGNLKNKEVTEVIDVTYDIGFEREGINIPAVKLHKYKANAYYLLHVHNPEELVRKLKLDLKLQTTIELPADIFDPTESTDAQVASLMYHLSPKTLNKVFSKFKYAEIFRSDALDCFSVAEKKRLLSQDLSPIKTRNTRKLAELWRRTLPTPHRPHGVSKKQYFETFIDSLRFSTH